MRYTNVNGHPTHRDQKGQPRCVRCARADAWLPITECLPGLPVHLPPYSEKHASARRYWLAKGFNPQPPEQAHLWFTPCLECWDETTDPVLNPPGDVTEAELVPGPAAGPGRVIAWSDDAHTPVRVLWVVDWPPTAHHCSAVTADLRGIRPCHYSARIPETFWARQVVTTHGSRWYGHAPGKPYHDQNTDAYTAGDGISFEHDSAEPEFVTGQYRRGPHRAQAPNAESHNGHPN